MLFIMKEPQLTPHFDGRAPVVREIFDAVVRASEKFGEVEIDPKKTSIHLNRKSAFAGVATRKDALILTIKTPTDIKSPRVHRREQVSSKRWHVEVRLDAPAQVDAELVGWLKTAFEISS
jgi:hypothetical protein